MKVFNWGAALGVRLPAAVVRQLDIREGDRVEVAEVHAGSGKLGYAVIAIKRPGAKPKFVRLAKRADAHQPR